MAAYHPADLGKHQEKRLASLASGEPVMNEVRLRRADGQYRWHMVHDVPLRNTSGNIVKWYGAAADIEERKRVEEALRRTEAYLAEAQRLSHTGSWAIDYANTKILHSSAEHHRLFGFDPDGGIAPWREWWLRVHPDDRAMTEEVIGGSYRKHTDFELVYRICRPDGTIKYLHVVGHPVLNAAGEVTEFVGTSIDETERRQAEESRRDTQNKLAHANRVATVGQLTASITHEIKQPLAATVVNANAALRWLERRPPDLQEVRQALDRIVEIGHRAGDVVAQIRALIQKAPPRQDHVNLNAAILEVIELARGEAMKNDVSMRTQLADGVPFILGDRVQLQQVVLNLVINAIEAMSGPSEGARDLLISTGEAQSNGVLVAVTDSGPGLDASGLDRLFDAFYTTKPGGLGMGLSICRSIIDAHGGRLWASANAPQGAILQFVLPAHMDSAL
jgi:PAS domain S-box-containing protein